MNQAESFFSRLRRAEIGIHHHISGRCLAAYAGEMAWRENNPARRGGRATFLIPSAYAFSHIEVGFLSAHRRVSIFA